MKVVYIKSRDVFGIVKQHPLAGEYIYYVTLAPGVGMKLTSPGDVVDMSNFIEDANNWKREEIDTIMMIYPEFERSLLETSAKFAKIAGK